MSARSELPIRLSDSTRIVPILVLLTVVWAVLLGIVFLVPRWLPSPVAGEFLTRNTVRVALLFYLAAVLLMLRLDLEGWRAATPAGKAARLCWTLGLLAYLIHLAMAMHHYHGWSHADAMRHVDDVSGFGPGIFMSHLFTLLWVADAAWWWLKPESYASRSAWIGTALHVYMAFIIFNGTVVYEKGVIRWAGVLLFVVLGLGLYFRLRSTPGGSA
jgi:hypothetical protein